MCCKPLWINKLFCLSMFLAKSSYKDSQAIKCPLWNNKLLEVFRVFRRFFCFPCLQETMLNISFCLSLLNWYSLVKTSPGRDFNFDTLLFVDSTTQAVVIILVNVRKWFSYFKAAAYEDKSRRLEIDLETSQKEKQVISEQVCVTKLRLTLRIWWKETQNLVVYQSCLL